MLEKLSIWEGFHSGGHFFNSAHQFACVIEDEIVDARRYFVEAYIIPFAADEGPDFVLQHDNARSNTGRLLTPHLQEHNI